MDQPLALRQGIGDHVTGPAGPCCRQAVPDCEYHLRLVDDPPAAARKAASVGAEKSSLTRRTAAAHRFTKRSRSALTSKVVRTHGGEDSHEGDLLSAKDLGEQLVRAVPTR